METAQSLISNYAMLTQKTRPSFHTLLNAIALTGGDETAIVYLETGQTAVAVTRQEFARRVHAYAAALQRLGIQPRDLVIIAHIQNLESIYAFWGAMLAGAVPSMFPTLTEKLDPAVYMSAMAELVSFSDVRAILTAEEFAPQLAERVTCPVIGNQLSVISEQPIHNLQFTIHNSLFPNEIAFLQHSSGTTGLQKGVALSHRAALNQIASYSDAIGLNQQDVIVSWLPLYHDMGLIAGFLLPLVQGVPLVLMSPFDWAKHPALLFRAIHEYKGTLCWLPNFAYNHCARRIRKRDAVQFSLASLRLFVNCSEPVRHDSHRLFLNRFAALGVTPEMLGVSYAMAENTFAVTQTPLGRPARLDVVDGAALMGEQVAKPAANDSPDALTLVSCGPPISGTAVTVLDKAGQPLPERQVGEFAIQSDYMLTEYYKRDDLRPFRNGCFLTGDRGYMADGEVFVIGRSKDLIINAGKNVYPQDIEAIVNAVPGIRPGRAVVFGVPDEREGTELIAVVTEVETADPAERKAINKAIRQAIARQSMVSASYVTLVEPRWLIKTSSGKIARAANREKWLRQR
ncbi:MAG: fatty acyl-AMP ligase [Chloroflexi bacterium]|nr:fatty acyl-AMP ligase [Chloroflexota bacterium]